jgi:hypothetical protein
MALPEADAANVPRFEADLHTNWKSLATNLRNQQTFGQPSQRNLNATAECAFAHRLEDYADRVMKRIPSIFNFFNWLFFIAEIQTPVNHTLDISHGF